MPALELCEIVPARIDAGAESLLGDLKVGQLPVEDAVPATGKLFISYANRPTFPAYSNASLVSVAPQLVRSAAKSYGVISPCDHRALAAGSTDCLYWSWRLMRTLFGQERAFLELMDVRALENRWRTSLSEVIGLWPNRGWRFWCSKCSLDRHADKSGET